MAVVISPNVTLGSLVRGGGNKPIIGWHNLVTRMGVAADYSDPFFPVSNLGNPSTASQWRSTSTDPQAITVTITGADLIDYVAIARHNLGSDGAVVSVEAVTADNPGVSTVLFTGVVLANNRPAILRFDPVSVSSITLKIVPAASPPRIGVLYVGKLTVMPGSMMQEPVALPYANDDDVVTGLAESGDFLGRIITKRSLSLSYEFAHVDYDWFHSNMGPFVRHGLVTPFFFAWLPRLYPDECGYGWLEDDVRPTAVNHGQIFLDFTLNIRALAV